MSTPRTPGTAAGTGVGARFFAPVQWDGLPDSTRQLVLQAEIARVVVDRENRRWRVFVRAPMGSEGAGVDWRAVATRVKAAYREVADVELVVEESDQEYLAALIRHVKSNGGLPGVAELGAGEETGGGGNGANANGASANGANGFARSRRRTEKDENTIFGRSVRGDIIPIREIVEEERSVACCGRIMTVETRKLRSGGMVIVDITDLDDSITVKAFTDDDPVKLAEALQPGTWIKVGGSVQQDRYSRELNIIATGIEAAPAPAGRADTAPTKRVELHLHTKMSAMDAVVEVEDAVRRAASFGHQALAITDHGVVQAFPDAYQAGKKHGVKVIFGMEGYLVPDGSPLAQGTSSGVQKEAAGEATAQEGADEDAADAGSVDATDRPEGSYHILLLACNAKGLENLYRLVSESHLKHFYRHPLLPRSLLARHREGLLLGTACESGELFQAAISGKSQAELEAIARFYDFLEIQPVGNNRFLVRQGLVRSDEDLRAINREIYQLGKRLGLPVVATGDVHFLEPEDEVFRRILLAGQGYTDAESQPPVFLHTTDEMLAEFAYLGEEAAREVVVDAPNAIAARCEALKPIPDELFAPEIPGAEEQIRSMTYENAHRIYGPKLPEIVAKRLEKELSSIIGNGFAVLYLIAQKLVKKSLDDGYLVGSRGSVGSSLVATMCGITEVNPLPPHYVCPSCHYSQFIEDGSVGSGADLPDKACPECGTPLKKDGHDIPFETFLGFEGDKVPDIDLNFSGEYQSTVHKYTEELFGADHVFRAGTIATLADRTAYGFVRKYLDDKKMTARNAEINRLVRGIAGVKRTTGQHPGGVMVVPKNLDIHGFSPIQYPANDPTAGTVTTHFDYKAISSRLVKLDILGHDDPTVIRMLQDLTGIDPRTVPLDDPRTMSIFSGVEALGVHPEEIGSNVGTIGIPEFGTRFVRQMLEATRPKTFSELVRISGFSHGTDVWLNNAADLIAAGKATLAEAIATRDDIMLYLIYRGVPPKTAFKIMEQVRKGKGLKDEDIEAMKKAGVPDWYIDSCGKIKYLFPKAHAVAYVTMAFRIAYFKVHRPEAFYASYFTVRAEEFDADLVQKDKGEIRRVMEALDRKGQDATAREKNLLTILEVVIEAMARGISFLPVDVYASDATRFLIKGKALLPPLASLQGLGAQAAKTIVAAREEQPFTSMEDLRERGRVSKTVIEVLRNHGALDGLPETNQMALF